MDCSSILHGFYIRFYIDFSLLSLIVHRRYNRFFIGFTLIFSLYSLIVYMFYVGVFIGFTLMFHCFRCWFMAFCHSPWSPCQVVSMFFFAFPYSLRFPQTIFPWCSWLCATLPCTPPMHFQWFALLFITLP